MPDSAFEWTTTTSVPTDLYKHTTDAVRRHEQQYMNSTAESAQIVHLHIDRV